MDGIDVKPCAMPTPGCATGLAGTRSCGWGSGTVLRAAAAAAMLMAAGCAGPYRAYEGPERDLESLAILSASGDLWIVGVGETHIGERKRVLVLPGTHVFHVRMPGWYRPNLIAFRLQVAAGYRYRLATEVVSRDTSVTPSYPWVLEKRKLRMVLENQVTGEVVVVPIR